jgi:hypothetical protein
MSANLATTGNTRGTNLVDVLDRVLDKGLVIAGDVKVSLAEVELLTIRIRLIVCSLDKAEEIGLDWWRYDRYLSPGKNLPSEETTKRLEEQVRLLERKVAALSAGAAPKKRAAHTGKVLAKKKRSSRR